MPPTRPVPGGQGRLPPVWTGMATNRHANASHCGGTSLNDPCHVPSRHAGANHPYGAPRVARPSNPSHLGVHSASGPASATSASELNLLARGTRYTRLQ